MSQFISRYQGPNIVYQHGLPHITGQESSRGVHNFIMGGGGTAFGNPIEYGVTSLASTDQKIFRQLKGYHIFDSYERIRANGAHMHNKFTLSSCVNYTGQYDKKVIAEAQKPKNS